MSTSLPALRGAILGFGQVAEKAHADAWLQTSRVRIVAVSDVRQERLQKAKKYFLEASLYNDPRRLFEKETLDFVDICTPPQSHGPLILEALRKKLHVLCEKPLTLDPKELQKITQLCEKHQKSVFTVHNWKYAPIIQKTREILDKKRIGKVNYIEFHTLRSAPAFSDGHSSKNAWRKQPRIAGGGILVDHGWHTLYLIQTLMEQKPTRITSRLEYLAPRLEHTARCWLTGKGWTGKIFLTWKASERKNWGFLLGSKGSLEICDDHLIVKNQSGQAEIFRFPQALSAGSAHPQWFAAMLPSFFEEMRDRKFRFQNLKEATACLKLLKEAYQKANN
ncbi:MAG: Gfo/Idh/MocA family oxidoreductase [Elusimicrobia bacterium]|nr:Gfo/Idh/MocA family oxidoreductase [Elusimicrobiota bacterium]